jgi:hypothetical protein
MPPLLAENLTKNRRKLLGPGNLGQPLAVLARAEGYPACSRGSLHRLRDLRRPSMPKTSASQATTTPVGGFPPTVPQPHPLDFERL